MSTEKEMKWYIVRSQSNREKSVSERLKKEAERGDLSGLVGRVLVPTEKSFFLKEGKKLTREKVMYPGYIFVETRSLGDLSSFVKMCEGATGILSDRSRKPQVLSPKEVERMIGIQEKVVSEQESRNNYIIGEEIKIVDGPFYSFNGTIENISEQRVKVAVMIFGRKTIVDLELLQIEKAD
jgi:transcriptional antiterminator NusG